MERADLRELLSGLIRNCWVLEVATGAELEQLIQRNVPLEALFIGEEFALAADFERHLAELEAPVIFVASKNSCGKASALFSSTPYFIKRPFEEIRLVETLRKIPLLAGHLHAYPHPLHRQTDTLSVGFGQKIRPVKISEVVCFSSLGNSSLVQTLHDKGTINHSLKYFEGVLDGRQFFRTGKSHLINLTAVVAYRPLVNGCIEIELSGGGCVSVARRRAAAFRRSLKLFHHASVG